MRNYSSQIIAAVALLAAASPAMALDFGTNITVSDNNYTGTGWYGNHEDQETETNPATVTSQQWDLEGMFVKNTALTLVGGFDFKNGVNWVDGHNYKSGDIFVDVNGDAQYGTTLTTNSDTGTSGTSTNLSGYDYALQLNYAAMTFNVIKLKPGSTVTKVLDVGSSNPWTYVGGGDAVAGYQNIAFTYTSGLTNADTGFAGDSTNTTAWKNYNGSGDAHYAITLDVGFLSGADALFHYTMECGNDDLIGKAHVPDQATTGLLLMGALAAMAGLRRKIR